MRTGLLLLLLCVAAATAHMFECKKEQCSCEGLCTNTFSHWQSHNAYNWYGFLRRPWPVPPHASPVDVLAHQHSEDRTVCGGRLKWLEALKLRVGQPNAVGFGRPQTELVREWIAARLNRWVGACTTPRLDELIGLGGDLVEEWCGTMVLSESDAGRAMDQLAAALRLYNAGTLGPGACGCGDGIVQEREDCDAGASNGAPGSCCTAKCTLAPMGTPCRASRGSCDMDEFCTGEDPTCPPDGFLDQETVCRPAEGTCDRAEHCTGVGPACPHDGLRRAGWVCRAAEGACDRTEACDGASPECPADEIHESGHVCRDVAGACDVPEACDGSSRECPADQILPRGTVCRAADAVNPCECTDVCDGQEPSCPSHEPLERFEYAVTIDTVSDTFEAGPSGSSGTLPWSDSSWILHQRGAGQEVSIAGDGNLNVTYISASGISARRALPPARDPARLAALALKGKAVLSRASAPVRVIISVGAKPCSELGPEDAVWCGLVRSASDERLTTQPLVTPSGREVPCDGLNLARRLLFHADVDPTPFREATGGGCLSLWTGTSEGAGARPTTLLFNDLTLEMAVEATMQSSPVCGEILVPEPGQTVAVGTCPLACPGAPGCLVLG